MSKVFVTGKLNGKNIYGTDCAVKMVGTRGVQGAVVRFESLQIVVGREEVKY